MPENSQFDQDSEAGAALLRRLQSTPAQPPQQPEIDQARRQRIAALLKQRQ